MLQKYIHFSGTFCPKKYPHPFDNGKSCCSSAWRSQACSHRGRLEISDNCCDGRQYPCRSSDSAFTCKHRPCMINSGANPGKPCILPFKYLGKTYNECTWEHPSHPPEPWCSTKVNSDGIYEVGYWGYCGPYCPISGLVLYKIYYYSHSSSPFLSKFQLKVLGQVGELGAPAPQHVALEQGAEPDTTMAIYPLLATPQTREAVKVRGMNVSECYLKKLPI